MGVNIMPVEISSDKPFVGYPIQASFNAMIVDVDVGALLIEKDATIYEGGRTSSRPKIVKQKRNGNWPKMQAVDRWIMSAKKGEIVFHRNGDLLDCRRENMVVVKKDEYRSMVCQRTRKSALGD
jgi:hypothetical protein